MRLRSALFALCSSATLLAACADRPGSEGAAADTAAMTTDTVSAPAAPAALSPADLAGRWDMRSVPETGDTTPTTYVFTATADTTGWTYNFPNRAPVPARVVAMGGDSVVVRSEPYQSVRRRGVRVWTSATYRREGDRLVGRATAHYTTRGADSVLVLRTEGTRMAGDTAR